METIGGEALLRTSPPVSAVYMKIRMGAQAPSCLMLTISPCGELAV
ncbi:MAG TPA: hypothetical protein VMY41_15680 [Thermohalobaculum sp.]|nr:hypothetical protein [Thermohalobaculum sp.]